MVNKLTNNVKPLDEVDKINEIIDELDNIDPLPSQTGQSGKYLTTNGTVPSWADVQSLPSQTGKAGLYLQTDGTDASWEGVPGRNIGEIVASTIPLTDAGLHLLDGSLIQGSGIYSAFVDYIADLYEGDIQTLYAYKFSSNIIYLTSQTPSINDKVYSYYDNEPLGANFKITQVNPIQISSTFISSGSEYDEAKAATFISEATLFNAAFNDGLVTYSAQDNIEINISNYFCSENDWQTAVTTYGVCGKFVYDSVNDTVRLPKITGILEGTTDLTALGDLVAAGLPNITGRTAQQTNSNTLEGAFYSAGNGTALYGSQWGNTSTTGFDASLSNSIYGNSSTVQPQTIKVLYYIVVATSTKTSIEVDIDEIATDLNGKADVDLSNCTKPHIVETYVNGTSWYNVYSNGWCEQGGVTEKNTTNSVVLLKAYNNTNYSVLLTSNPDAQNASCSYFWGKTSTTFECASEFNGSLYSTKKQWQASGYIS